MTGLLPNYFTGLQDNSTSSMFSEASSTSLMAATTYRYAQLGLGDGNVGYAEDARRALQQSISPEGWLRKFEATFEQGTTECILKPMSLTPMDGKQ